MADRGGLHVERCDAGSVRRWLKAAGSGGGVLALIAGMVTCLGAPSAGAAPKPKGTVNIGLLAEFSGTRAELGPLKLKGVELASQVIDRGGGCDGQNISIKEIDGPDPVDTTTSIDKALSSTHLSLVLGSDVNSYTTGIPLLEKAKMVNFSYLGTPGYYTQHKWNYSFQSVPSDAFDGAAMAYYAKLKGYKRVAVVLDAEAGSEDLLPSLKKMAKHDNTKIVATSIVPESAPSYSGTISKVLSAHPQAILFQLGTTAIAGEWGTEWKQAGGTKIPIIGSTFTAAGTYLQALGTWSATDLVSAVGALAENDKAGKAFLAAYTQRFNNTPPVYASHFYDAMTVACLAMDAARSTTPKVYVKDVMKVTSAGKGKKVVHTYTQGYKLLRQGKSIKYFGVSGPMTYTPHHQLVSPYQVVQTTLKGTTKLVTDLSATALTPGLTS